MDNAKTKIAIISYSLGTGGAERFAGTLSFMLEDLGYEIHNIIVNDAVDYEFAGSLYNLGARCHGDSGVFKKIRKGLLLRNYLRSNDISILIDNRTRNSLVREIFTSWIYGNRKQYFVIHSYHLQNYLPQSKFFAKWLYGKAEKLICVSKAIEAKVIGLYGFENTAMVYNPVQPDIVSTLPIVPENYILFYGRLDEKVKNFTLMLEAFSQSKIYEKGYQLVLLGSGPSKEFIEKKIEKLQLKNQVLMFPFLKNPFGYVSKAKFTLLTSHHEGFPMSIIESLSLGTPAISVDCNSGPREIISQEENGLLVENYNPKALAEAMNRMVDDEVLYHKVKSNAAQSVAHLAPSVIIKTWEKLLKQ